MTMHAWKAQPVGTILRLAAAGLLLAASTAVGAAPDGKPLKAVPFNEVKITSSFWKPRIEANTTGTLAQCLRQCEQTGRLANFARAGRLQEGPFQGTYFDDSDVYKVIEGAAYCLAHHRDPKLEARIDEIIDWIAAAQQPDGYLNTYYTLVKPQERWTDLFQMHEMYCAGHMFEAAVAYAAATGKTKLLDVARRKADHIDATFGPGKRFGYSGHEEIELALVKLGRATGEQRYLDLARWLIDVRGTGPTPGQGDRDPVYIQAHKPIRQQDDVVGHAVRAMYLYAGVADVAALTGDADLFKVMESIWNSVVRRKMYVTGGVGSRHGGEAFGEDYELPNDTAYCETCAAIGLVLWNQRLLLLHGESRFADVVERAMYNGILSGVSLDGERFFYVNPLSSRGTHHRQPWYKTACCPTNLVRFVPSVGGYVYATDERGVWVNLYVASQARITGPAGGLRLTQETDYPWSGKAELKLEPEKPGAFELRCRVPGWCRKAAFRVNGEAVDPPVRDGYAVISRTWKAGDEVELELDMPIERVQAHPAVVNNRGRVALQRGPVVYCVEAVDHGGRAFDLILPRHAPLSAVPQPQLLGGVVTLRGKAHRVPPLDWADRLYQPVAECREVDLTAIPYYAWDHREPGEMTVWLPEAGGLEP